MKVSKVAKSTKDEPVFKEVEHMPEFKGGQQAFFKYIQENVTYPQEAKEKGIEGKVFVEFILNKKGEVASAWVKKPADPSRNNFV